MRENLPAFIAHCRERVDHALQAHLHGKPATRLYQAMAYSLFNGGKRVRPILCYAAADFAGGFNATTDTVACALEMIHAYSLIHDDLPAMDDDDLRRGKPTCHIAFDEATAILAGDGLQALAFELLSQTTDLTPALQIHLIRLLASASGPDGMVAGQSTDLNAVNQSLTLEQLEAMHRQKTGALINAAVTMGALSSAQDVIPDELDALGRYSRTIGLAFQVKDDILDEESSTELLGKRQGADLALNKPTYTSLLGLAGAKAKLRDLHRESLAALAPFGSRAELLSALADYIVTRDH